MCRSENVDAVVPVRVVLRSIENAVQLVTIQTEQVRFYLPEHETAASSALTEALGTAKLLCEQLAAIQDRFENSKVHRLSTLTFFDSQE